MKVLDYEGLNHYNDKIIEKVDMMISNTEDKIKMQLDNKSELGHSHDKTEQLYSYTLDLSDSTFDQNTYYPVIGNPLPQTGFVRIKLSVQLNSQTVPTWSTHAAGFTCSLDILTMCSGWGVTNKNTIVLDHSYMHASSNPCGYHQMHTTSRPVLWLRGGGRYYVWSEYYANWDIKNSEYVEGVETLNPTITYPGVVINRSTILADLDGTVTLASSAIGARYSNFTIPNNI